jgi:hypothetical protein
MDASSLSRAWISVINKDVGRGDQRDFRGSRTIVASSASVIVVIVASVSTPPAPGSSPATARGSLGGCGVDVGRPKTMTGAPLSFGGWSGTFEWFWGSLQAATSKPNAPQNQARIIGAGYQDRKTECVQFLDRLQNLLHLASNFASKRALNKPRE